MTFSTNWIRCEQYFSYVGDESIFLQTINNLGERFAHRDCNPQTSEKLNPITILPRSPLFYN